MADFFDVNLLKAVLRMATPLIFAAMGGLICERSGIMNIGLEGMMLTGAFVGVLGTYYLHNPWWGLICAILAGGAVGLIHAFWSIGLRSDQIVTGTAINLLAAGITIFLTQRIWSQAGRTPNVETLPTVTGGLSILVPISFLMVPIVWFFLRSTKPGLRLMASGESPQAAESVGIGVDKLRY